MKRQKETEKIVEYIQKLSKEQTLYETLFAQIYQKFIEQSKIQIDAYFIKAKQTFAKTSKNIQQQLITLKYYNEHPQQKFSFYPLFNQIQDKLGYNFNLIEESQLKIALPFPNSFSQGEDITNRKLIIMENYLNQLLKAIKSDNLNKYCKKQVQTFEKINQAFGKLLANVKEVIYTPKIKISCQLEQGLAELTQYQHVQNLTLCLTSTNGILMPIHYHQIVTELLTNRAFLRSLTLKIMDMEFSQEKSDILRKRLSSQFKFLKQVKIQNYYKECKLGQFQDFNWQPFRKIVNITASVW